jgi:hypothetical protein
MTDVFAPGPDKAPAFGRRHTDAAGRVWELAAQNDLCVPYYARVVRGRRGAALYTLDGGERIARALLADGR